MAQEKDMINPEALAVPPRNKAPRPPGAGVSGTGKSTAAAKAPEKKPNAAVQRAQAAADAVRGILVSLERSHSHLSVSSNAKLKRAAEKINEAITWINDALRKHE